jgi:hypothetical protein
VSCSQRRRYKNAPRSPVGVSKEDLNAIWAVRLSDPVRASKETLDATPSGGWLTLVDVSSAIKDVDEGCRSG